MVKFKNIAVLIDAENVSANKIDQILTQISEFGHIGLKYVYGDFKQENLAIWDNISLKYLLKQIHTPSLVKGKNSSDIALVIDAMDLLFHGYQNQQFDCFCLVSSDSDFSNLAKYIRHQQKAVIGIGRNNTLESFKMACDKFLEIDNQPSSNITLSNQQISTIPAQKLKKDTVLMNAIRKSIQKVSPNNEWANFGTVNLYLKQDYAHLTPEQYGYSKWRELVDIIDLFEIKIQEHTVFIRQKTNTPPNTATTIQAKNSHQLKQDLTLIKAIQDSIRQHSVNGWVYYGVLNNHLNHTYPKLSPKSYGYTKWRTLIEQIDLFEIKLNNSSLFVREKSNGQTQNITKPKINNQFLLDDILQIINENNLRTDEWVHIGYLGSQLKNKGYNPKDFGFKSFTLLLEQVNGIISQKVNNGLFFTLKDRSKIKPITLTLSNNSINHVSQQTTSLERTPILEPSNIKQSNQELLNIITQIINGYKDRKDEWVRAAYITVQLKLKNYQAQKFGYTTLLGLLYSLPELVSKTENHILYFTLVDRSKVKIYERTLPIRSETISSRNDNMHSLRYPTTYTYSDADYIDEFGYPHWD